MTVPKADIDNLIDMLRQVPHFFKKVRVRLAKKNMNIYDINKETLLVLERKALLKIAKRHKFLKESRGKRVFLIAMKTKILNNEWVFNLNQKDQNNVQKS